MRLSATLLALALAYCPSVLSAAAPATITFDPTAITTIRTPTTIRTFSSATVKTSSTSTTVKPSSTSTTVKPSSTSTTIKPSTNSTTIKPTTTTQPPTSTDIPDPTKILDGPRTTDMLADIKGLYGLPQDIKNVTLNIKDIQCDILVGMQKKIEIFYFFYINNAASYKAKFLKYVAPRITSVAQMMSVSTQPVVALNVAYSQLGLNILGFPTNVGDTSFGAGQVADAVNLGDPGTTNWDSGFKSQKIAGVFLIASDTTSNTAAMVSFLQSTFGSDITKIQQVDGSIRPPPFDGHEMFGYLDGISQPAIAGFINNPLPGQEIINAGTILVGEPGDPLISARPSWAKDGSFLAFRKLQQLVPEFDKYLLSVAPAVGGFTQAQSAELLGARMMGRWKSGAPVDLFPLADNPSVGSDPFQNNDFTYAHTGYNLATDQFHCPFGAHSRKTRPRADQPGAGPNSILRSGIPYGGEVTESELERATSDPKLERGLAFVGYQSVLSLGFQFIQEKWANTPSFPSGKNESAGFDPIIGANHGSPRPFAGYNIQDASQVLTLPKDFVVSKGGEYFFSPSIKALNAVLHV